LWNFKDELVEELYRNVSHKGGIKFGHQVLQILAGTSKAKRDKRREDGTSQWGYTPVTVKDRGLEQDGKCIELGQHGETGNDCLRRKVSITGDIYES
jgi:hypothetical protein